MNNRISKPQSRRSRPRLPQEQLLHPVGLPQDARERSTKRQLDDIDQSPAKKPSTNAQLPEAEGEGADEAPVLQHPRPKPPSVSFLQKFIDPIQPANSKHRFIHEWLESAGSSRDRRCRLESRLQPVADYPIPPRLTRSALTMRQTRKAAKGSTASMPPSSSGADSPNGSNATESSSKRSLVEEPTYRDYNLVRNNIYYDHSYDPTPTPITELLDRMRQGRDSPGPSADEIQRDARLEDLSRGASEARVENYFLVHVFPDPEPFDHVTRTGKRKMAQGHVPSTDSEHRVSIPIPDVLYGYTMQNAFPQQLRTLKKGIEANNDGLLYPFLLVEFKGESGSLWVATNQCLGGSATCVNITEELNVELRQCTSVPTQPIDSAAFSIAIRNTEARLYVSWKQDEREYHMADVGSYLLHDPEQSVKFRKIVHNILDWGRGKRLEGIRKSLDCLKEEKESQEKSSAEAKSTLKPMPSAAAKSRTPESGTPSSKRQRH
ncbi:hypothetical protein NW759_002968 [Fusarium solani]|nr:hypothetical protein NW759_002968 [Fusarium solani]